MARTQQEAGEEVNGWALPPGYSPLIVRVAK